jgi:hypothetical protein
MAEQKSKEIFDRILNDKLNLIQSWISNVKDNEKDTENRRKNYG